MQHCSIWDTCVGICVDLFVHVCVWMHVFVNVHVCLCEHVRLCVDGAFVTQHPRCQRDTVGWWRKGWGPREEVFLYCCTAVETVALSLSLSYSRLFSGIYTRPGGGIQSVLFNKERVKERRGWRRRLYTLSTCSSSLCACAARMSPQSSTLWTAGRWRERKRREEEMNAYVHPGLWSPRALDPGKSASSVFFDPACRAAQWIHCHVNMCISIHRGYQLVVHYRRKLHFVKG